MLTACSAARLGYNNGPALGVWWLDGYLDLDDDQEALARQSLKTWFDWHRSTQLPDYAQWLATWVSRAEGEVTGAEVCQWTELGRDRMQVAADRAAHDLSPLLSSIRPAQWAYLEREMAERLTERREEMSADDPQRRQAASLDRAVERGESFYGSLTPAQRKLLASRLASSPLNTTAWLNERERRQSAFMQGLRQAQTLPADRRGAELKRVMQQFLRPPDGEYAVLQARWQAHTCQTSAELHNSASPQQRQHLRERLSGWEEDLRVLAAAVAS